jgi:hypothetical protein
MTRLYLSRRYSDRTSMALWAPAGRPRRLAASDAYWTRRIVRASDQCFSSW